MTSQTAAYLEKILILNNIETKIKEEIEKISECMCCKGSEYDYLSCADFIAGLNRALTFIKEEKQ